MPKCYFIEYVSDERLRREYVYRKGYKVEALFNHMRNHLPFRLCGVGIERDGRVYREDLDSEIKCYAQYYGIPILSLNGGME